VLMGPRCASVNGCSLHANTDISAHWCDQLERLIATQPEVLYCLSGLRRTTMETSCISPCRRGPVGDVRAATVYRMPVHL
jgi:hypothetical protein